MKKIGYILIIGLIGVGVFLFVDSKNFNETPKDVDNIVAPVISEHDSVEKYLLANISKLSPVSAVLGGTWYVVSFTVDIDKNSGNVIYEDGHIQEKRNFTYTTNEKGEVVGLTIK